LRLPNAKHRRKKLSTTIRPLTKDDLPAARRILRTAFGTFLGAPDPENFWADLDYVYGRFAAEHVASFAAEVDGELVGSNFATRWGSVGFFGPITVRPDRQTQGIGKALVEAVRLATRLLGHPPCRIVYLPAERHAPGALSEIRFPRPLSDRDHGDADTVSRECRALVALF